jgi:glycosyltransferase involved in cell wall biosynthesis
MHKISVCVPTYNRPDTLRQLINSYLKQNYDNKELIISDDSPNDSIKKLVAGYKNTSIKYFHNKKSLRFARNLFMSMARAKGDYLIMLGDDDVLLNEHALSDYVNTFKKYQNVGFVYSNMVQFSLNMDIEYVIKFADKNMIFKKGEESIKRMWIRSIYIGGLGIRNAKNILNFFPDKKLLHPQVEFAGHILNKYDSILLKNYNIGFRSHDDQIIFRALKNKELQQEGNHVTSELFDIYGKLKKRYKFRMNTDFLANELINLQTVMMFKEKRKLGTRGMEYYYKKFQNRSPVAKSSMKLITFYFLAKYFPSNAFVIVRKLILNALKLKNSGEYIKYRKQLEYMIS